MSTNSDARDIIDAVQSLQGPVEIDPEKHYAVPLAGESTLHVLDPADEKFLDAPRRPRGVTVAYDVDALKVLWEKHAVESAELFGDPVGHNFTGILNADLGQGLAGFRDHRVQLVLRPTVAWKKWLAIDGVMMGQVDFAEFIEARLVDVVSPAGAAMLELASTLEASSTVEFKSSVALGSGVRSLTYEEKQTAKAGETGQLEIPKEIVLGICVFEGGDAFSITARFRHRIRNGQLALGVVLDRPEDVLKAAFDDYAERVGQACDTPVLLGTAPPATLAVR